MRVQGEQRTDWKVVRRLASDIVGFAPRTALLALVLVMAGAGVEAVAFLLLSPLLTLAQSTATGGHGEAAMPQWWPSWAGGAHSLHLLLALITVALLLRQVIVNRRQAVLSKLELGYFVERQTELIAALAAAPWPTLARLRHARITHLLTNDIHRMGMAAVGLLQSLTAIITLAIMLVAAMVLNVPLALLSLLFAAVVIGLSRSLLAAAQTTAEDVTSANLIAIGSTGQFLGAVKSAIAENLEKQFVAEFTANRQEVVEAELTFVRRQGRSRLVIGSAGLLIAAAVAAIGFAGLGLAPATIIALLALLSRMTGPVAQLQSQLTEMVRAVPAYRHVLALQEELVTQFSIPDTTPPPAAFREVAFRDVSYRHRGSTDYEGIAGVDGVNLTIPAGEFLGVAGPSGSGKTTFADLLVGLVDPDRGAISLDGARISLREARWWRDRIAYIPQDPFLRHASVRDNLRSLTPDATDDDMIAVLEFVGAEKLLRQLPDGLDTLVGERGSLVSGGERQRLALARALLRQPQLLLLDEATNALDQPSEDDFLSRLAERRADRTTILITHRLSSLTHCDRIAVFRSGVLVIARDVDEAACLLRAGGDIDRVQSCLPDFPVA